MRRPSRWIVFAAVVFACGCLVEGSRAELIVNGGFETGNFSGWFVPPSVPNQSLFYVSSGGGSHNGTQHARLSSSTLQFVSQILATEAGTDYELSFWLRRPSNVLSRFVVRWEGAPVFDELFQLPNATDWHQFTFPLHANITGSLLEFGQRAFPLEYHIDDISVAAVPAPGAAAVLALGGAAAVMQRRRR